MVPARTRSRTCGSKPNASARSTAAARRRPRPAAIHHLRFRPGLLPRPGASTGGAWTASTRRSRPALIRPSIKCSTRSGFHHFESSSRAPDANSGLAARSSRSAPAAASRSPSWPWAAARARFMRQNPGIWIFRAMSRARGSRPGDRRRSNRRTSTSWDGADSGPGPASPSRSLAPSRRSRRPGARYAIVNPSMGFKRWPAPPRCEGRKSRGESARWPER